MRSSTDDRTLGRGRSVVEEVAQRPSRDPVRNQAGSTDAGHVRRWKLVLPFGW
jgi:hypothetical protein